MKAHILTKWIGDGQSIETANRPKLTVNGKVEDITGQPSGPGAWWKRMGVNLLMVNVECDNLDGVEADPEHFIMWKDNGKNEPAAEFGQLMAYLAQNGMAADAARQVLGNSPNGRTRAQIADTLRQWLKHQ